MKADAAAFAEFRRLTREFIVIPDAWDIMSAVIIQAAGHRQLFLS